MKFKITFKDPDVVGDAISDAARIWAYEATGLDDDERDALIDTKKEKLEQILRQWIEYGEYLVVEVDTEAKTMLVVPTK